MTWRAGEASSVLAAAEMRIAVILPGVSRNPVGGFRVHYEYANRLADRGHEVVVLTIVASRIRRLMGRWADPSHLVPWFSFGPRVRFLLSDGKTFPESDVALLTAWQTAELVPLLRGRVAKTVHLVYDYEFWNSADECGRARMSVAFARPDVTIAGSSAVRRMLEDAGRAVAATIPCGIDHRTFFVTRSVADRDPVAGFLARASPLKRHVDAVEALERVRHARPIRVRAVAGGSIELPTWIERVTAPTDALMREFYNSLSVFLLPSEYEGWGLPAAEAMACGAAVVSTRNGGVEDFAIDGKNAWLVPARNSGAIATACARVLDDDTSRLRIVSEGLETIRGMQWDQSVTALETLLCAERD